MWPFVRNGPSGFSSASTAEEVARGIDGIGLTAIVTGASSGIGAETTRVLAKCGVHVVMAVRDISAGNRVKENVIKESPTSKVDVLEMDLSSLPSVKKFASDFNALKLPLNILINNAGVMATPYLLSDDGIELQFATNHLGHFLLTYLLLDNMKKTSQDTTREGRIVNVSSEAHKLSYPEGIRFDKINDEASYNTMSAYGQSKLANILHANQLSRHLKEGGANITVNSLHPGIVTTNLFRHHPYFGAIFFTAGKYFLKNVEQGAATTCYVAMHPQVKGISGQYFNNSNIATPSVASSNENLAKKLWEFSMKMVEQHA